MSELLFFETNSAFPFYFASCKSGHRLVRQPEMGEGVYHDLSTCAWCLSAAETCGLSEVTGLAPRGADTLRNALCYSPEVLNLSTSGHSWI